MRDEFRDRFFTPFVLPVTVIGAMLLFGLSLSRVLMAVSELGASFIAVFAAGYIMAIAFFVESRKRITARTLGVALAIGLFGLVGAGAVASAAGMRELEPHGAEGEEAVAEGDAAAESGAPGGAAEGDGGAAVEPVWVAIDLAYESAPEQLPAGEPVEAELINDGAIVHNVVIEELDDELILEAEGGQSDQATITLDAGDYTYYCSIPGHRAAGMEGTLTAAEGVEVGTGDGATDIGSPSELGAGGPSEG